MKVIWAENPISAERVVELLSDAPRWKPKTIKTLINRLLQKGALDFEKQGRIYLYSPRVTEEECLELEANSFLTRFFEGSLNPMLAYFFDREDLSPMEIQEIKKMVSRLDDGA